MYMRLPALTDEFSASIILILQFYLEGNAGRVLGGMEGIELNPEKIAFLVDSTADLMPEHIADKPIYVVPLRISCADGDHSDGEDITNEDVYRRQEAGELPKTSLPDLVRVAKTLDRIRDDGYEKVLALPLSSGLSGTFSMIRMQCLERKDIEAVAYDTLSGAMGIGMIVLELWEEIGEGLTWEKMLAERLPFLAQNTRPYFSVDTLEYLQKGGRIGKITALAGTLLSIKPLISFNAEGELVNVAKARGRRQVPEKLIELVKSHVDDPSRPFNLAVENGGDPEGMAALGEALKAALPGFRRFSEANMDATLATYVGRGMLGAAIQFLA